MSHSKKVLIAGAGGGFDVFSGLPLYFGLRDRGCEVHLANLAFTRLRGRDLPEPISGMFEVGPGNDQSAGVGEYFPEKYLSTWLSAYTQQPTPVYAFERSGVIPIRAAYLWLAEELALDTIILVDGGTDSLMRGDESGLGTPHEDATSLAALEGLEIPTRLLVCLGFGVDSYHGVCHTDFLEAVSHFIESGAFLGCWSLTKEMSEVQRFRQATEAVFLAMPEDPSIVCASILAALEGKFGNHHSTHRTSGTELFINPLMSLYWSFQLDAVAQRLLYLEPMKKTHTWTEVRAVIRAVEKSFVNKKPYRLLPM